jgi:erythromycin esterase-like protein
MRKLIDPLLADVRVLEGGSDDFDSLMELIGDNRFVLIGEASHGTHEFYQTRADITRRLIREKGFCAVAVEGDWPDAYRVNRFVRGLNDDGDAVDALGGFARFPQWMWRNSVVLDFVGWLRAFNEERDGDKITSRVGFYGLDLYSLFTSVDAVLRYLDKTDPPAARRARSRYACFDHYGEDPQSYGYAANFDLDRSCMQAVIEQLVELREHATDYARRDGRVAADQYFFAEHNARIVKNAERYYRSMFEGRVSSWNLRDRHMVETLDLLVDYLDEQRGEQASKIVVWAHNSHLGDARATQMGEGGEVNVGQLVRENHPGDCVNIGFSTYSGTVTAADDWGEPAQRMRVRPGMPGSYEELFHQAQVDQFLLDLRRAGGSAVDALRQPRLQRAIGVIYRPQTERLSHYFHARLAEQFDAMIHIDRTRALEPLERTAIYEPEEAETYPTGV